MSSATRRTFGLMAGAAALGGCATPQPAFTPQASPSGFTPVLQPRGPYRLAPVHVSEDRVIRTVVGLRPFRPSGFVNRAEPMGEKLIVHNYGHGGGGITLSWGSAMLAADIGFQGPERDYAVLGCGALGLATARAIQRRGGRVTIYAKDLPPDTTSNIAGGQWWPASVYDAPAASAAFLGQFTEAARRSYREFQLMAGERYGVRWTRNYYVGRQSASEASGPLAPFAPEARRLSTGEHPFGSEPVVQADGMQIEPMTWLKAMLDDVRLAGGRVLVRELRAREEVLALPEPVIFNCTGLGARALFGDEELVPVRGQLVILLPQPEVTYNLLSGPSYMFPRTDGIVLGGTYDRGQWDVAPNPEVTARILSRHRALFARMETP